MLVRKKIYYVLLLQFFIYLLIQSDKLNTIFFPVFVNCESIIKVVVEGSGKQTFLRDFFSGSPSNVIINGSYIGGVKSYSLEYERTEITLIFNTQITTCSNMFSFLDNITEIDLSEFDASKVESMEDMFYFCKNLQKVNFGNMSTPSLKSLLHTFNQCRKLVSVDLYYFNTSQVVNMAYLFSFCYSLKDINISNLDTSQINSMDGMFYNCYSLQSLNLSHFNYSGVESFEKMFENCYSLQNLTLANKDIIIVSNKVDLENTFKNCSNLEYLDLSKFYFSEVDSMDETFYECKSLKYLNLFYISNINNINSIGKTNTFLRIPRDLIFCTNQSELIEIAQEYNLVNNNCSNEIFLGKNDKITNYDNNPNGIETTIQINNANNNYYSDNTIINYNNSNSSNNYDTNILNIIDASNSYINNTNNFNNTFINNTNNNSNTINNIILIDPDNYLKSLQKMLSSNFDRTNIDKGIDLIHPQGDVTYTITSTLNQKNNINKNNNLSSIDLLQCETKLKEVYDIPENKSLYILKIDIQLKETRVPRLLFEIYYPFFENNMTKLDLSICKDIAIDVYIPYNITYRELYYSDPKSDIYNNYCYIVISNNIDKPLKERRKEFVENDLPLCEDNCELNSYNNITNKVSCSCFTKIELPLISEVKFDKEKLFSNFKKINNIANFELLKCFHLFFSKNNIFKNTSNYLMFFLFILRFISIITFIFYYNEKMEQCIKDFTDTKKNKIQNEKNNINNNIINNINDNKNNKLENENQNKITYLNIENKPSKKKRKKKRKIKSNSKKSRDLINNSYNNKQKDDKLEEIKTIFENQKGKYNSLELNSLEYEEALKIDKRTYFQYYKSLLFTKHILIFTFFNYNDYNSLVNKIYIFFFTFIINYTISAMFYSDNAMSKIYNDKGSFDFTYQLPIMFYSLLISSVLKAALNYLGLYEENILNIKKSKEEKKEETAKKEKKKIKIKLILFYTITYILLFFFWIFLGCFCAVYKKTQVHLLIDVASSFALSFITPFGIYLLPGLCRIPAIKKQKKILFKISNILQIF